jgi:hypothetical protein
MIRLLPIYRKQNLRSLVCVLAQVAAGWCGRQMRQCVEQRRLIVTGQRFVSLPRCLFPTANA